MSELVPNIPVHASRVRLPLAAARHNRTSSGFEGRAPGDRKGHRQLQTICNDNNPRSLEISKAQNKIERPYQPNTTIGRYFFLFVLTNW